MQQAIMISPGQIKFQEVPVPEIAPHQVLLKMQCIGVCGSDIHVWHGKHPYTSYPVVQGHEVSAQVVKTGSAVTGYQEGDRVTVQPQVVCGACYPCTHGQYNVCESLKVMGFQTTGMASDFFAVDAQKLVKLPQEVDYELGAMIEPLAVAVHALRRGGSVQGKKVLVLGAGTIGNLVAQAAKGMGAAQTIITDLSDYRLGLALECGVDHAVNTGSQDLAQAVLEAFGPDKADIIFECVGVAPTMDWAVANARKGTRIVVVGVFGERPLVDLGLVQDRELELAGTAMYREEDYYGAIDLIAAGSIELGKLISTRIPFSRYPDAYRFIEEQGEKAMKVMIQMGR